MSWLGRVTLIAYISPLTTHEYARLAYVNPCNQYYLTISTPGVSYSLTNNCLNLAQSVSQVKAWQDPWRSFPSYFIGGNWPNHAARQLHQGQ